MFEDLSPVSHTQGFMGIDLLNVWDAKTCVKRLQKKDPYHKCIQNTLNIPPVKNKFTIKDNILFKVLQDVEKSFEALVVLKSLALMILANSHSLQAHAGTSKTYSLIKRELFWKMKHKDINKIIWKSHISGQPNLPKQTYNYMCIRPPKRPFNSLTLDLIGPFHPSSKGNTCAHVHVHPQKIL